MYNAKLTPSFRTVEGDLMNDSTGLDERPVEEALRERTDLLDRHLERGGTRLAAPW